MDALISEWFPSSVLSTNSTNDTVDLKDAIIAKLLENECIADVFNETGSLIFYIYDATYLYDYYNIFLTRILPATIVCPLGIILNCLFLFVIQRIHYMRTYTNFYLCNLAVVDVMFLTLYFLIQVVAPISEEVVGDMSYLGPVGCPIVNILLDLCLIVSEFSLTLFTVERFVAICYPLKAHRLNSKPRTFKLIALTWILGAACCAPLLYFYLDWYTICIVWVGMNETDTLPPDTSNCWRGYDNTAQAAVYTMTPVVIFIAVLITITVLDILTMLGLHKSAKACTANAAPAALKIRLRRERSVVAMLVVTASVYFLCLFPYHLELIFTFYNYLQDDYDDWIITGKVWSEFVRWLPMVNSTVNPIIYGLIGKQYRQAFKRALCFCGQERRTRFFSEARRPTYSTSFQSSRRSRAESQNRGDDVQMNPIDTVEVRDTGTKNNVSNSDANIKSTGPSVNNNTEITNGQDSVGYVINALEVGQLESKNTGDGFLNRELDNIYF